jgi:hypothetical protein
MSGLYTKVTKTGLAALKSAASESLDAELRRYATVLRASGRKDEAALADYWAGVVASVGPAAEVCNAVYAAIRIGAAVERANSERAFTEPVLRSRKIAAGSKNAAAKSIIKRQKKRAKKDERHMRDFEEWRAKERKRRPKLSENELIRLYAQGFSPYEGRMFRRLFRSD